MKNRWNFIGERCGQEALIFKGYSDTFPGIGGEIVSKESIKVINRVNTNKSDYFRAEKIFCKHVSSSILDEFFLKQEEYSISHIPIPLGCYKNDGFLLRLINNSCPSAPTTSETYVLDEFFLKQKKDLISKIAEVSECYNQGYYYQYVGGDDNFSLTRKTDNNISIAIIPELISFFQAFSSFGFNMKGKEINWDTPENIIMRHNIFMPVSRYWKRIDFGDESLPFNGKNYDKFKEEVKNRERNLIDVLGEDKFKILLLCAKYASSKEIQPSEDYDKIKDELISKDRFFSMEERGALEMLMNKFRKEAIQKCLES